MEAFDKKIDWSKYPGFRFELRDTMNTTSDGESRTYSYYGERIKLDRPKKYNNNRVIENGFYKYNKLKLGIQYIWEDNGTCFKFDVDGNLLEDFAKINDLRDKVVVLTEMVQKLQEQVFPKALDSIHY